ncbi:MAG: hypothetical protein ABIH29_00510 [Candidatus Micrarchaeota archaeon]
MKDCSRKYLDLFLWIVLGVILGTAIFVLFLSAPQTTPPAGTQPSVPTIPQPPAQQPPAEVAKPEATVTVITYDGCEDCNSTVYLLGQLKDLEPNFNFTLAEAIMVAHDSPEGIRLIEKYGIGMLPTMIVSSEASVDTTFSGVWAANVGTIESDGSFVFRKIYPPYFEASSDSVRGFVDAYVISPERCDECEDLNGFIDYLAGDMVLITFSSRQSLNESDDLAQELIGRYNITKLPVFLLSNEVTVYPVYGEQLALIVSPEADGWQVLSDWFPPYVDLGNDHKIVGLVEIVKLVDSSCEDCFDPEPLAQSITSAFGLYVAEQNEYDISSPEGRALVEKYDITLVPTVLVSPEASEYSDFSETWTSAGDTMEADGWYVYRSHAMISSELIYRDLSAPELPENQMEPPESEPEAENGTTGA